MRYLKYGIALALGILGGYTIAYSYFDKKYEEEFDKALDAMVDIVKKDMDSPKKEDVDEASANFQEGFEKGVDKIIKKYNPTDEDATCYCHFITYDDYFNIPTRDGNKICYPFKVSDEYERTELIYYDEDDILYDPNSDETDAVIEHPYKLIGDLLLHLDDGIKLTDDEDIVYIRNDKLKTQYEIAIEHSSYEREVLGLEEE